MDIPNSIRLVMVSLIGFLLLFILYFSKKDWPIKREGFISLFTVWFEWKLSFCFVILELIFCALCSLWIGNFMAVILFILLSILFIWKIK